MATIVGANVPVKGTKILNPKTNRMVTVGKPAWLKLVKAGVLNGMYTDPKQLSNIKEDADIDTQRKNADKSLPPGQQSVRGRGKYKGKLVTRKKPFNEEKVNEMSSRAIARSIKEGGLNISDMSIQELQDELTRLSRAEIARTREHEAEKKGLEMPKLVREKVTKPKRGKYRVKTQPIEIPKVKLARSDTRRRARPSRKNSADVETATEYETDTTEFSTTEVDTDLTADDFGSDTEAESVQGNHADGWGYDDEDTE